MMSVGLWDNMGHTGRRVGRPTRRPTRRPAGSGNGMRSWLLWWSATVCLVVLAGSVVAENITAGYPPVISAGPPPHVAYNAGQGIDMVCRATGSPPITYEWYKDGVVVREGPNGSYLLQVRDSSEGFYQCHAFNQYGRTVSNVSWLQRARLEQLDRRRASIRSVTAPEGGRVFLPCNHSRSVPQSKTRIQWYASKGNIPGHRDKVKLTDRIALTEDGTLIISYLLPKDGGSDLLYKCTIVNQIVGRSYVGSFYRINVENNPYPGGSIPTRVYTSPGVITVLKGQNVSIKCIFSARPSPVVSWRRVDGPEFSLPLDRIRTDVPSHDLSIRHVRHSDAGRYECTANNTLFSQPQLFDLVVHSSPRITIAPYNQEAIEGSDVTYTCVADATPPPEYNWYINEKQISDTNLSWRIEEEGKLLVLPSVTKDDRFTVHCNASNIHGYVMSAAYLIVLPKPPTTTTLPTTTVTTTQPSTEDSKDASTVMNITMTTTAITPTTLQVTQPSSEDANSTNITATIIAVVDITKDNVLNNVIKDGKKNREKDFNSVKPNHIGKSDKRAGDQSEDDSAEVTHVGGAVSSTAIVLIVVILVILICIISLVVLYVKRRTCRYHVNGRETEVDEREKFNQNGEPSTIQVIDTSETTQLQHQTTV